MSFLIIYMYIHTYIHVYACSFVGNMPINAGAWRAKKGSRCLAARVTDSCGPPGVGAGNQQSHPSRPNFTVLSFGLNTKGVRS